MFLRMRRFHGEKVFEMQRRGEGEFTFYLEQKVGNKEPGSEFSSISKYLAAPFAMGPW